MPGGTIRYVPLQPPKHGAERTSSAADWTIDFSELEKAINPKTKMIVRSHLRIPLSNANSAGPKLAVRISLLDVMSP